MRRQRPYVRRGQAGSDRRQVEVALGGSNSSEERSRRRKGASRATANVTPIAGLAQGFVKSEPHLRASASSCVRTFTFEFAKDRRNDLRRLVLAHLLLATMRDGVSRKPIVPRLSRRASAATSGVASSGARFVDVLLEVLYQPRQDLEFSASSRSSGTPER